VNCTGRQLLATAGVSRRIRGGGGGGIYGRRRLAAAAASTPPGELGQAPLRTRWRWRWRSVAPTPRTWRVRHGLGHGSGGRACRDGNDRRARVDCTGPSSHTRAVVRSHGRQWAATSRALITSRSLSTTIEVPPPAVWFVISGPLAGQATGIHPDRRPDLSDYLPSIDENGIYHFTLSPNLRDAKAITGSERQRDTGEFVTVSPELERR